MSGEVINVKYSTVQYSGEVTNDGQDIYFKKSCKKVEPCKTYNDLCTTNRFINLYSEEDHNYHRHQHIICICKIQILFQGKSLPNGTLQLKEGIQGSKD